MKYGTHGYCGKGKRSGSKRNRHGNIVPQVSGYASGASKRKQALRRPVKEVENEQDN